MLIGIMAYAGISAYNVSMNRRKLKKANKKIVYKLGNIGFDMSDKETKNICHDVVRIYDKNNYDDLKIGYAALSFFPILNIVTFINNIKDDKFLQDYYDCGIEKCVDGNVIVKLLDERLITQKKGNPETASNFIHEIASQYEKKDAEKKEQIINNFKEKEYSIEELRIIRDYINGQMNIEAKPKVRTR